MKLSRKSHIRHEVCKLLKNNNINEAPVDVEGVARSLEIIVRKTPGKDDISGFLLKQANGTSIIGINTFHHPNRQRFTLGHEIGHFILHDLDEVHVDRFVLKLRNQQSSTGQDEQEIEANGFAAELLMPAEFLVRDLLLFNINDLHDDRAMQRLAKRYQVSVQAMTNRLVSLGYIEEQVG